jgi:hypothetical protein
LSDAAKIREQYEYEVGGREPRERERERFREAKIKTWPGIQVRLGQRKPNESRRLCERCPVRAAYGVYIWGARVGVSNVG